MEIGILGGSFDPIHNGHLMLAETAWKDLSLERLIFIPTHRSPWKSTAGATAEQRFEMVSLAIQGRQGFENSRIELERSVPSYTIDTLRILKQNHPADQLWLIIGADGLGKLPHWRESREIIKIARIAVGHRPGEKVIIPDALQTMRNHIQILDGPQCDISSTAVRQRIREEISVHDFLPASVADYIRKNGLYR
jgi:nicotinate-nucleotide adenylyltransferase